MKYTVDDIAELYYYCSTSPSGLRRSRDWRCGQDYMVLRGREGDEAGSITQPKSRGGAYYIAWVGDSQIKTHTLVWELHYGKLPDGFIVDHIDGDSLNNKLENLRVVSTTGNARNHRKRNDNKTGVTGVSYDVYNSRYVAMWNELDGKPKTKSYAILKYGVEEAFRLACEHRSKMLAELNKQGAGYTERHGE